VLFWKGCTGFEYNIVRIFVELVQEARVFLDVGANIGYYSLLATAYNPEIRILSFEPLPSAFHYLQKNLELNQCTHATPLDWALSDTVGTATFFASKKTKFLEVEHHLTSTGSLDRRQAERSVVVESFEVKTETLDHVAATHLNASVDLLKLDTEASEDRVLAGAQKVLAMNRPIIFCEVLPGKIEKHLEAIMRQHDYVMFRVEAEGLVPVEQLGHSTASTNDHLFVPADGIHKIQRFLSS
jgi:FkbM family methyltransferase